MAHGLPDYFTASLPGKSIYGTGQSQWFEYGESPIPAGENAALIDYTVPDNTLLVIATGFVSCSFPCRVRAKIDIIAVTQNDFYFSEFQSLPFSDMGIYELTEGQQIIMTLFNYSDEVGHLYTANLIGYEITETQ